MRSVISSKSKKIYVIYKSYALLFLLFAVKHIKQGVAD